MRRFLAPALALAVALSGCGKKSETTGSGAAPPPSPGTQSQTVEPIDPAKTGTVTGVVKLEGWLKPDGPVTEIRGIPWCNAQHPNGPPIGDKLVLGDGQTMANVLVYVKSGLGNRRFDPPKEAILLDQVGCIYTPHVCAVQTNQILRVHNSDSILHNVHGEPKFNRSFNKGQPNKGAQDEFTFGVPEIGITVKCNVHPWMEARLHVLSHPFFNITGKDGAYTLKGLPEGEHEIHAWHEKFDKPEVMKVTVKAKETVTHHFTFKGGTKP